ncbi:hypothetical protein T229_12630 [Tannerella sp. oral taxon BU063 isolate Cell 5]|uniref:Uncharacterized protein n=1 Tax=Tannerella sp. oral taxon BU063 isolate Cell 5 TaxID=1410950 RepID=W2C9R8_9BACT|nr:hypothetical protein T229_12630 [Tannerella sp. oral taxon BU063 isolate Cell 5]
MVEHEAGTAGKYREIIACHRDRKHLLFYTKGESWNIIVREGNIQEYVSKDDGRIDFVEIQAREACSNSFSQRSNKKSRTKIWLLSTKRVLK